MHSGYFASDVSEPWKLPQQEPELGSLPSTGQLWAWGVCIVATLKRLRVPPPPPPPLCSCFHVPPPFHLAGRVAQCPTTVPGLLASLSIWLPVDIWWCILIKEQQAPPAWAQLGFNWIFASATAGALLIINPSVINSPNAGAQTSRFKWMVQNGRGRKESKISMGDMSCVSCTL